MYITRKILLVIIYLIPFTGLGQVIPEDRRFEWSLAGNQITGNYASDTLSIEDFGGKGDSSSINDQAVSRAIADLDSNAGVIYFPPGKYLFNSSINLPDSVVLKGAGSQRTSLIFNLNNSGNLINISSKISGTFTDTITSYPMGTKKIKVSNGAEYTAGSHLKLIQDNGKLATSSWAQGTLGQIIEIESVNQNTLTLEQPLRMNFSKKLDPRLKKMDMITNAGVECLKVVRQDQTSGQTSNINFQNARNCWVKGVESYRCNFSHVEVNSSTNIEVRRSYFHHAFAYGGGGEGYGVTLHLTTGESLIENNIFEHLRHSILLQASANGNVIAYNYSKDPHKDGFPNDFTGDLVLHGNYPFANLFEGNIVQTIVIDDSHGINGPFNTIFRNRTELYGFLMEDNPATDSQNFVGQEITGSKAQYQDEGDDHFEYGINYRGSVTPQNTDDLSDKSYYLDNAPYYWTETEKWPSIGVPRKIKEGSNPAKIRYQNGIYAPCTIDTTSGSLTLNPSTQSSSRNMRIFPDPFADQITLELSEGLNLKTAGLSVLNASGKTVQRKQINFSGNRAKVSLPKLPPGVYWIMLKDHDQFFIEQVVKSGD